MDTNEIIFFWSGTAIDGNEDATFEGQLVMSDPETPLMSENSKDARATASDLRLIKYYVESLGLYENVKVTSCQAYALVPLD